MENKIDNEDEEEEEEDINIPISEVNTNLTIDQIDFHEEIPSKVRSRSPSPEIIQQSIIPDTYPVPTQPESARYSATPSLSSSVTSIRPSIRVEINEKYSSVTSNATKFQKEPTSVSIKQSASPTKTSFQEQVPRKR